VSEPVEVRLPRTSRHLDESVIVLWYKSEGDHVKSGDVLVEIQTEKATFEVTAPADGIVQDVRFRRGDVVRVGDVLCRLVPEGLAVGRAPAAGLGTGGESTAAPVDNAIAMGDLSSQAFVSAGKPAPVPGFVAVAPRLRRLAQALGVDLTTLKGSGPGGRITEDDIRHAATEGAHTHPVSDVAGEAPGSVAAPREAARKEVTRAHARRTIARRMMQSLHESAQLTLTAWADVTNLYQHRTRLCADATWTDWVARAVICALRRYPEMNAIWRDDVGAVPMSSIHLGIAVDTEDGLLVPVIRDADQYNLAALHVAIAVAVERARHHELTAGELSGSTFTVTNLGAYGVVFFTPILNPPESGILGVGAVEAHPHWDGDHFRPSWRLPLSLTFDHRVLDGAPAARFLSAVCALLREPEALL
jgi:pyruvate dehydrogenase E2 component (dihydrolipoamide acetyltransferase)